MGTAEAIYNIQLLVRKFLLGDFLNGGPSLLGSAMVIVLIFIRSPPNSVVRILVVNDELVLRRTSGVDTSHYVYGAKLGFLAFFVTYEAVFGFLIEQNLV